MSQTFPHNTEMFTLATSGYVPFVLNLHESLKRVGLGDHLVAYTLDDESDRALTVAGLTCRRFAGGVERAWSNWRTTGFQKIMEAKYSVALNLLRAGRHVLHVDSDIVFLKNPMSYLQDVMARSSAHLVLQSESPQNSYNAGFWFASPAPQVIEVFSDIQSTLRREEHWTCDQRLLNERVRQSNVLKTHALDPALFACGNQFLEEKRKRHFDPAGPPFDTEAAYLLHFNFIIGMETKVLAMKKHGALMFPGLEQYGPSFRRTCIRRAEAVRTALSGQPVTAWPRLLSRLVGDQAGKRPARIG
ncbi:MAG: hypothetical protein IPL75_02565 [Acidobacteria bacterium]|nr:hypothetical protein [Acidobacteriota bacterium]